ncbi:hypothetical protein GCM10009562_25380 [Nocardioides aquaticus]
MMLAAVWAHCRTWAVVIGPFAGWRLSSRESWAPLAGLVVQNRGLKTAPGMWAYSTRLGPAGVGIS